MLTLSVRCERGAVSYRMRARYIRTMRVVNIVYDTGLKILLLQRHTFP